MVVIIVAGCMSLSHQSICSQIIPNIKFIGCDSIEKLNSIAKSDVSDVTHIFSINYFSNDINKFISENNINIKFIKIPQLDFYGFHPDYYNAFYCEDEKKIFYSKYSSIALWSYKNRISISDSEKLFNYNTYCELGYFDFYHDGMKLILNRFMECGFSRDQFLKYANFVNRQGKFMHSVNHPKIEVLVQFTRIFLCKANLADEDKIFSKSVTIPDSLAFFSYPLYPEIANEFGLKGEYIWDNGAQSNVIGIRQYLTQVYRELDDLTKGEKVINFTSIPQITYEKLENVLKKFVNQ